MTKIVFIILIHISLIFAGKPITLDDFRYETEQYKYEDRRRIGVERIDTTCPMYSAYAYITIDAPFEKVAPHLLEFENYDDIFDYILDVKKVRDRHNPKDTVYYIEGKAIVVHAWGLGKVTQFDYYPDSLIDLKVRPVSNTLFKEYYTMKKGVIRYHTRKMHLDAKLIRLDNERCRVGLKGFSVTNKPIPTWMLSIMFHILLPGLMNDLRDMIK